MLHHSTTKLPGSTSLYRAYDTGSFSFPTLAAVSAEISFFMSLPETQPQISSLGRDVFTIDSSLLHIPTVYGARYWIQPYDGMTSRGAGSIPATGYQYFNKANSRHELPVLNVPTGLPKWLQEQTHNSQLVSRSNTTNPSSVLLVDNLVLGSRKSTKQFPLVLVSKSGRDHGTN